MPCHPSRYACALSRFSCPVYVYETAMIRGLYSIYSARSNTPYQPIPSLHCVHCEKSARTGAPHKGHLATGIRTTTVSSVSPQSAIPSSSRHPRIASIRPTSAKEFSSLSKESRALIKLLVADTFQFFVTFPSRER